MPIESTSVAHLDPTPSMPPLSSLLHSWRKASHESMANFYFCRRDGEDLVDAAETFCVNCVSVNAELVPPCIKALVKQFLDIPLIPQGHQGEA